MLDLLGSGKARSKRPLISHLPEGISEFSVIREALDALLEQAPACFTVPCLAKGP